MYQLFIKLAYQSLELKQLLKAKKVSDQGDYSEKNRILGKLLNSKPNEFRVDSILNKKYVGLTHTPTGFKIHAPRMLIPMGIEHKYTQVKKHKNN